MRDLLADSDSLSQALAKLALEAYLDLPVSVTKGGYAKIETFVYNVAAAEIRYPTRMQRIKHALNLATVFNFDQRIKHLGNARQSDADDTARYLHEFAEKLFALHAKTFADAEVAYELALEI